MEVGRKVRAIETVAPDRGRYRVRRRIPRGCTGIVKKVIQEPDGPVLLIKFSARYAADKHVARLFAEEVEPC